MRVDDHGGKGLQLACDALNLRSEVGCGIINLVASKKATHRPQSTLMRYDRM